MFDKKRHDILRALFSAATHMSKTKGGAHTEVFIFEQGKLLEALMDHAKKRGLKKGRLEKRLVEISTAIADRFILKVGNIENFTMKLGGSREAVIKRHLVSEVFGPLGYNILPTINKAITDSQEAVREIPYFAYGGIKDQFCFPILESLDRFFDTGGREFRENCDEGIFFSSCLDSRSSSTVFDILTGDPYFRGSARNFRELRDFQRFLRKNPLDSNITERLISFFEMPITVGVRDVIRWLGGARHPRIGWKRAEETIIGSFRRYGNENFLLPEINYYTYSAAIPEGEFEETLENNLFAAKEFALEIARCLEREGCFDVDEGTVQAAAYEILSFHHDYPQYEVEPYSGIMSSATLKLLGRVAIGLALHLSGIELPQRRNFINAESLKSIPSLKKISKAIDAINLKLLKYMISGFQRGGKRIWFKRIPATFYTFQEKAYYHGSQRGRLVKMLSLEDLLKEENRGIIIEFPEIAEKLTVFFVLVYRYFLDTGFIADLRPDDVGKDLFLKGIWGYKTPNVLIMIFQRDDGTRFTEIKFVDNKDQFKQYRRGEDRQMPLGLAKYGLRLAYPLIQPAMERSIGIFTNAACEGKSDSKPQTAGVSTAAEQALKFTGAVLRQGVDSLLVHTQAFLHDLIDDATEGVINIIKKF